MFSSLHFLPTSSSLVQTAVSVTLWPVSGVQCVCVWSILCAFVIQHPEKKRKTEVKGNGRRKKGRKQMKKCKGKNKSAPVTKSEADEEVWLFESQSSK